MNQFTKRGYVVTAVHAGIIGVLLVSTELSRLFIREKTIRPVEFTVAIPDLGQKPDSKDEKIQAAPQKTVEAKKPEPLKDEPKEELKPEPKKEPDTATTIVEPKKNWEPKKANEITIGPKVKSGPKLPPPTTSKPSDLSEAELRRLLDLGALPSDETHTPEGDALFDAIIQNAFKRNWVQPEDESATGKSAVVEVKFSNDGRVLSRRLIQRSGNAELDQSIEAAIMTVTRVDNIPRDYFERCRGRRTITYRIEGGQ